MTSLEAKAASGARWTGSGAAFLAALRLTQTAVLARLLHQSDFGLMSMALVVVGFGQILADAGIGLAVIQRRDVPSEQLSTLYWFNLLLGASIFLAIQLSMPLAVAFYGEEGLRQVLISLSYVILLASFGQVHEALLRKWLQFRRLAVVEVLAGSMGALVAIEAALAGEGAQSLVLGQVASVATKSVLLLIAGGVGWSPRLHFRCGDLRGYLRFGMFQTGSGLLGYSASNVDKLLIGRLLGADALGFYTVAWSLVMNARTMLNPVITKVTFPLLVRIQTDRQHLRRAYLKIIETVSFVNLPIHLGMFAVAEPLIAVYLGPGWQTTSEILRILVFLGILYAWGNPLGPLALAMGRPGLTFGVSSFNTAIYLVSIFVGSPWGLHGVAISLVLASCLITWPAEYWVRWLLVRVTAREYLEKLVPFLFYSALMAALVVAVDSAIAFSGEMLRLSVLVGIGAVTYGGLIYGLKGIYFRQTVRLLAGRS